MKFKVFLTENGVVLMEKRFLPTLDKMGKIFHLYLTRDHAIFLHNLLNGNGIQSIAQFHKGALFDEYLKKLPQNSTHPMPFLTFKTKGFKFVVIQDVPDLNQLQNFVDQLKHVGELLNVSISKYGDLHL
ncbi:hypothetical protein UlMin_010223 [Ulmus minor]